MVPVAGSITRGESYHAIGVRAAGTIQASGLPIPEKGRALLLAVRLAAAEARKFDLLAKRMKLGRSKMARLILEKFIAQHDPDREGDK